MSRTILITGATSGIGLEAAKTLHQQGHKIILHGRSAQRIDEALATLKQSGSADVDSVQADLSRLEGAESLARDISARHSTLDVIINNAGIFRSETTTTDDGLDLRFAVNTYAPALLTDRLLPLLSSDSRVINLSSAAQAPVSLTALAGSETVSDQFQTYAQSKLALTMWNGVMAEKHEEQGPVFIAVNPGSLLATRMVKEGFGTEGKDITIGSGILVRCAVDEEFKHHSGEYFDNDSGQFAPPHQDALDRGKTNAVVDTLATALGEKGFALANG